MPSAFTASLAKRLNEIVAFPVRLASTGMPIEPGTAYLAPGKFHLTVMKRGTELTCRLTQDPPRQGCRPSLDCLLESLVPIYGSTQSHTHTHSHTWVQMDSRGVAV